MPVVRLIRHFAQVPNTWEGWAMRVLTIAVVIMIGVAWILLTQTAELKSQIDRGRNERNAFQVEQTVRSCAILRQLRPTPGELRDAGC